MATITGHVQLGTPFANLALRRIYMKKALLAFSMATAFLVTHSAVLAKPATDPAKAAAAKKTADDENSIANQLLVQVLNSIEMRALDINIDDAFFEGVKDEKTGDMVKNLKINNASATGIVDFTTDWRVDLITPKENSPKNANIEKLLPKLLASASPLSIGINAQKTEIGATLDVEFFKDYKAVGKWEPSPLVLNVYNKMSNSMLTVYFFSLSAKMVTNPKTPDIKEIQGTCKAQKDLLDIDAGVVKRKDVDCQFKGVWTNKGYKIHLKWANK
jgi:hypothetical protein